MTEGNSEGNTATVLELQDAADLSSAPKVALTLTISGSSGAEISCAAFYSGAGGGGLFVS